MCWWSIAFVGCVLVNLLLDSLDHAHISPKEACLDMGIDAGQWSRQTHGDGHVSVQRIEKLPVSVIQWWAELIQQQYGRPAEIRQSFDRRRMARMEMPAEQEQIA